MTRPAAKAARGPAGVCGNDAAEGDEECDGADLAGWTCELQGFDGGEVACDADCGGVDTSGCFFFFFFFFCGDDLAAGREVCDGTDLGGSSCATEGFDSGVLICDPQCWLSPIYCPTVRPARNFATLRACPT